MNVICVQVGQDPYLKEIDNTLSAMQNLVGGFIETVTLKQGLVIVCNEEGKILNLPVNKILKADGYREVIVGDFFIAGVGTDEDGEPDLSSIPEQFIDKIIENFSLPEINLKNFD